MKFHLVLAKAASDWGERQAIFTESGSLSYIELNSLANKVSQSLIRLGFGVGDRVAYIFPNSLEFVITHFGIPKAGCVCIPINTRLASSEIQFILEHSDAKGCVFDHVFQETLEPLIDQLPPDFQFIQWGGNPEGKCVDFKELLKSASEDAPKVAFSDEERIFYYTSGTTGDPKGVILNIGTAIDFSLSLNKLFPMPQEDRAYLSTPLFHLAAASLLMSFIVEGRPCYLTREWKRDTTLELIQNARINFMWAVPTMLALLIKHPQFGKFDLSSLKRIYVGGSALSMDLIKAWKNAYPNLRIQNGYAQTETSVQGSLLLDEFILKKPDSIGKPPPGVEMTIVDDDMNELAPEQIGEIAIKSPTNMIGYHKNPELTRKTLRDGWCLTGDTGYKDKEGFFYFTGRKKDMIIRGGENVFPDEIEAVINRHPKVLESTVIGKPDPVMGEEVLALVVLKPGQEAEPEDIISQCQQFLADYKVPKFVYIVPDLPKTSTLKVNKNLLRDKYCV